MFRRLLMMLQATGILFLLEFSLFRLLMFGLNLATLDTGEPINKMVIGWLSNGYSYVY